MTAIKWVLVKKKITLYEFKQDLAREGVNVVLRQNSQGNIYGLTYIDFRTKCVFNGSDLGKEYSAKAIMERLHTGQSHEELNLSQKQTNGVKQEINIHHDHNQDPEQSHDQKNKQEMSKILELLLKPERNHDHMPHEFLKKKRPKQSRSSGLHL